MKRYSAGRRKSRGSETCRCARHHLYDLDYERRLLGALLTDSDAARKATSSLTAEDFMLPERAILFEAIRVLEADGLVPSSDSVAGLLAERGFLSAVPAISDCLADYIPSADASRVLGLRSARRPSRRGPRAAWRTPPQPTPSTESAASAAAGSPPP